MTETAKPATVASEWPQFFPKPDDDAAEIDARALAAGWVLQRVDADGRRHYEPARRDDAGNIIEPVRLKLTGEMVTVDAVCRAHAANTTTPRTPGADVLAEGDDEDDGPLVVEDSDEIEARAYRDGYADARNQYEPAADTMRAALAQLVAALVNDLDETADGKPGPVMAAIWDTGTSTTAARIRDAVADAEAALGY